MKAIVPGGYAIPREEMERLVEEARKARAAELSKASEEERARIEKEIRRAARLELGRTGRRGFLDSILHL